MNRGLIERGLNKCIPSRDCQVIREGLFEREGLIERLW
jgi:hypothetical protein